MFELIFFSFTLYSVGFASSFSKMNNMSEIEYNINSILESKNKFLSILVVSFPSSPKCSFIIFISFLISLSSFIFSSIILNVSLDILFKLFSTRISISSSKSFIDLSSKYLSVSLGFSFPWIFYELEKSINRFNFALFLSLTNCSLNFGLYFVK